MSEKVKLAEAVHLREDMNLVDIPFALTDTRPRKDLTRYRHEWTGPNGEQFYYEIQSYNPDLGFPTFQCEEFYLAAAHLMHVKGLDNSKILCTPYELLKTMGWGTSSRDYDRLLTAADRLFDTSINTNYFYDKKTGKRHQVKRRFHILSEICFEIIKKKDPLYRKDGNYIRFSQVILDSMRDGYSKSLDYETFKAIKGNIAKRLYRYIDKQLRYQKHYQMELNNLTQRILMMKKAARSDLIRRLQPAFDELMKLTNDQGKQLFRIEIKPGKHGGDIVHFYRLAPNRKPPVQNITHTLQPPSDDDFIMPEAPF